MTKDNWIKEFDEKCNWTAPIHQGEYDDDLPIYGFEEAEKIIKSFISQVEKDAIEKTNKGWRDRIKDVVTSCGLMIYGDTQWTDLIKEKLSDLLEDK